VTLAAQASFVSAMAEGKIQEMGRNLEVIALNLGGSLLFYIMIVGLVAAPLSILSILVPVIVNYRRRKKRPVVEYEKKKMSYIKLPLIFLVIAIVGWLLPSLLLGNL
jgi:hypothetical protein